MNDVTMDALAASFGAQDMPGAIVRPMLAGGREPSGAAFEGFLRSGATIELKAFTGVTGDSGGFAIPRQIDVEIDATLKSISPIRSVANVVQVGTAGYRKLVTTGGTPSGWAAETDARTGTATPVYAEIAPPMGELYANPSASQQMLDDAAFDVEAWLAGEIAMEFAKAEGAAFVNGSGTARPKGFLQAPTAATNDTARAFGTLQYLASGAAGDFAANPQDRLIDLVQSLRGPYRQGAVFVMNSSTLARIRKFKTSDGQFLWTPSLTAGTPATLLGYPVIEAEDMPDIAANSLSVAFGNFKAGYLIAERSETVSRIGWRWIDGVDAPLGEERERYRVTMSGGDGAEQTIETDVPELILPRAQRLGGATLSVRQVGSYGESAPAACTISDWTS